MYNQVIDSFNRPHYMQPQTADEVPLFTPSSSSLAHSPHQPGTLPLDAVDFGCSDPDRWLEYNFQPYDFPEPFSPMDPTPFPPVPYYQTDPQSSSGGVLASPFSLATSSDSPFSNQPVDPDYLYTFPRHLPVTSRAGNSSIPSIRVITDVPLSVPQCSPPHMGNSPYSETSSGSSFPSHPSTPLFPQIPYYNPSPVSDIVSPETPDYPINLHQYALHSPQTIWDIVTSFPPTGRGPPIPQKPYRPHTLSDRKRYVEEVELEDPITFLMKDPDECGILLGDALTGKYMRLKGRDDAMFVQRGPSVSIRLKWPGYGNWSRQIPTKDFRSPPGPITRAKLAKNIARTVERFIKEKQSKQHLDPEDEQWRVGPGFIGVNDLILVGLQHVSKGSWQAHLRLARPRNNFPTS